MKNVSARLDSNGMNMNGLVSLFATKMKFGMVKNVSAKII